MYLFEQKRDFDITRTLRVFCRKLIRKHDIVKAFEDCNADLDNLVVYYHPTAARIQCVYITFASPNEARRVYENRDIYESKLSNNFLFTTFRKCDLKNTGKYDVKISVLGTNLYKIAEKMPNAANTLAIIRPITTLEVVDVLPAGPEYIKSLVHLINGVTQLDEERFVIKEDRNPLTGEPEYQHVFVTLPSKQDVDRLYQAQPYFGCLIAHKLSHIQICSYLRYNPAQCLMCSSKKNPSCIHDMCQDCCARQKFGTLVCKCSADIVQSLLADRKQKAQSLPAERKERIHDGAMRPETVCEKCQNEKDPDCANGMCAVCCPVQAIRLKCLFHDESYYSRALRSV